MIDNILICPVTEANRLAPTVQLYSTRNTVGKLTDTTSTSSWGDYNNDGTPLIVVSNTDHPTGLLDVLMSISDPAIGNRLRVFKNLGSDTFTEIAV